MSRDKTPVDATRRLSALMRSVRKRLRMNTTEFARKLGVAQSVVSRYENGSRSPGWRPLARLLLIAEGPEKKQVLKALSRVKGQPVDEVEATREAQEVAAEDEFLRRVGLGEPPGFRIGGSGEDIEEPMGLDDLPPNLSRFLVAASIIGHGKREVDESLSSILELWLRWGCRYPEAARYFQDAERFLRVGFQSSPVFEDVPIPPQTVGSSAAGPFSQEPTAEQRTARYRVILRFSFGDGVEHQPGEILTLDLATAREYSHALMTVGDDEEQVSRDKKLA